MKLFTLIVLCVTVTVVSCFTTPYFIALRDKELKKYKNVHNSSDDKFDGSITGSYVTDYAARTGIFSAIDF